MTISESGGRSTIDQLLSDASFAAYEGWRYGPIVNLRLNGKRIGTLPSDFGFGGVYQADAARKKADELLAVGNTLVTLGMTIADLRPSERPDFIVSIASGSELLVEVADVVSPCRNDSVKNVMQEVHQAVESNSSLKGALEGRSVFVTLQHTATTILPMDALTDDCPGDHINRSASRKLVTEIVDFIRRGDIATHIVDKNVPLSPIRPQRGRSRSSEPRSRSETTVGHKPKSHRCVGFRKKRAFTTVPKTPSRQSGIGRLGTSEGRIGCCSMSRSRRRIFGLTSTLSRYQRLPPSKRHTLCCGEIGLFGSGSGAKDLPS